MIRFNRLPKFDGRLFGSGSCLIILPRSHSAAHLEVIDCWTFQTEDASKVEGNFVFLEKLLPAKVFSANFDLKSLVRLFGKSKGDLIWYSPSTRSEPFSLRKSRRLERQEPTEFGVFELTDWMLDAMRSGFCYFGTKDKKDLYFRYPVFRAGSAPIKYRPGATDFRPKLVFERKPVSTYFHTPSGQRLTLSPGADAGLIFTPWDKLLYSHYEPYGSFDLAPDSHGHFEKQNGFRVVCGGSALEYAHAQDQNITFNFVADQPAWMLPSPKATGEYLIDKAVTSWLRVSGPSNARSTSYRVQPLGGELYSGKGVPALEFLDYPRRMIQNVAFPWAPFGGLQKLEQVRRCQDAETGWVFPERKRVIDKTGFVPDEAAKPAATPQGLVVKAEGGGWKSVQLTKSELSRTAGGLSLSNLDKAWMDALAQNRVFIVASASLDKHISGEIVIDGWTFRVKPNTGDRGLRSILIVKFYDATIQDLIGDITKWSSELAPDQKELKEDLAAVLSSVDPAKEEYRRLNSALTQKSWNGVLAFNCEIKPTDFPTSVQGIAAGMTTGLKVDYFGVQLNRLADSELAIDDSSMFGLFQYSSPNKAPRSRRRRDATDGDGGFQVKSLTVIFGNSAVQDFKCSIALTLTKLFDVSPKGDKSDLVLYGHYEKHDGQETYSFYTDHRAEINFTSGIFEQIVVDKVQFTSAQRGEGLFSRFSLWGEMSFQDKVRDVLSFSKLRFANLGFKVDKGSNKLTFDPADVSFDLSISPVEPGSLLDKFPLKLEGFQFAPGGLDFDKLGFVQVTGDLGTGAVKGSKFGLLFNLDLGSLGSLVPSVKGLNAEILLVWTPQQDLQFGIRLPNSGGGRLAVGLEGVAKVVIGNFAFKKDKDTKVVMLLMQECHVEFLGEEFPGDGKSLTVALFSSNDHAKSDPVAWYAGIGGGSVVDYIGLGERVAVKDSGNLTKIIDQLKGTAPQDKNGTFDPSKINQVAAGGPVSYSASSGWLIGGHLILFSTFHLRFLFLDPSFYAASIEAGDFHMEIHYSKINDAVGLYYTDIHLPISAIPVGVALVELGSIAVSIYTDGSFRISAGFPEEYDFSRSFVVEAPPLIGFGGLYFGRANPDSTKLIDPIHGKVYEAGFAFRGGYGVDFRTGPLTITADITVVGILQGAVSVRDGFWSDPGGSIEKYLYKGQWGILGELKGRVDFGIIKASVNICVYALVGVQLEPNKPVLLFIDAGIHVDATVVLADFHTWYADVHVEVHFSFDTRYHWEKKLDSLALAEIEELSGGVTTALPMVVVEPADLEIVFHPEVSFAGGKLHTVILLGIEAASDKNTIPPFGRLVNAFLDDLFQTYGFGTDKNALDYLGRLDGILNDNTYVRKTYKDITNLLGARFKITIRAYTKNDNRDTLRVLGLFPLMPECLVKDSENNTWDFSNTNLYDGAYQEKVHQYLRGESDFKPYTTSAKPMVEMLFEDYVDLLTKTAVHDLLNEFRDHPPAQPVKPSEILNTPRSYANVAGQVTRYLKHGLRLASFDIDGNVSSEGALYEFSGQQHKVPSNLKQDYDLIFAAKSGVTWFQVAKDHTATLLKDSIQCLEDTIANTDPGLGVDPKRDIVQAPYLSKHLRRYALSHQIPLGKTQIFPFPQTLIQDTIKATTGLPVQLKVRESANQGGNSGSDVVPIDPGAHNVGWALVFDVKIRKTEAPQVYSLTGTDNRSRTLLQYVLSNSGVLQPGCIQILDKTTNGLQPIEEKITLSKVNLSRVTKPELKAKLRARSADIYRADATEPVPFLRLLFECSVVRAGGFYLSFEHSKPVSTKLTVKVTLDKHLNITAGANALSIENGTTSLDTDTKVFFAEAQEIYDYSPVMKQGNIGFVLRRKNPKPSYAVNGQPCSRAEYEGYRVSKKVICDDNTKTAIEAQFSLLSYAMGEKGPESVPLGPHGPAQDALLPPTTVFSKNPDWCYSQTLQLVPPPACPPSDNRQNPYGIVGNEVTLYFWWRDVYGNKLGANSWGSKTLKSKYFDPIIPVTAWPAVSISYSLRNKDKLLVSFAVSPEKLERKGDTQDQADNRKRQACETLLTVQDQLTDPNATLTVESSLGFKVNPDPNKIGGLLSGIRAAIAAGTKTTLTLPEFDVPAQPPGEIFPLSVTWHVVRKPGLVDDDVRDHFRAAFDSITPIPPQLIAQGKADKDSGREPSSLTTFADAFEKSLRQYKLATVHSDDTSRETRLFVVDAKLLKVAQVGDPVYFAPRPLSNKLWTGEVTFPVYSDNVDKIEKTDKTERVSDVDLDEYARFFLAGFEEVLSAGSISAMDAESFGKLMTAKNTVAEGLKPLVGPLRENTGSQVPQEVTTAFHDHVLDNLTHCYSVHGIVQLPVAVSSVSDGSRSPRLYGKIDHTPTIQVGDYTFTFVPAKLPLREKSSAGNLTFLFGAKPVPANEKAYLPPIATFDLGFTVTHIERDMGPGGPPQPEEGYRPTSWLALIVPEATPLVKNLAIPIPLRKCPVPPVITSQAATLGLPGQTKPDFSDIVKAKAWIYALQYEQEDEVRDEVTIRVQYPQPKTRALPAERKQLAESLVRFQRTYSQLRSRLTGVPAAMWLKELAALVKECSGQWGLVTALTAPPPDSKDTYSVTSEKLDTYRTVALQYYPRQCTAASARIDPLSTPIGDPVPTEDENKLLTYLVKYEPMQGSTRMVRKVSFERLDAILQPSARGEVTLQRNKRLGSFVLAENFVYRTPPVAFGSPTLPPLEVPDRIDLAPDTSNKKLMKEHLALMFEKLFGKAGLPADGFMSIKVTYYFDPRVKPEKGGPFLLATPVVLWLSKKGEKDLEKLASAIEGWLRDRNCGRRGALSFSVAILPASGGGAPVVRFHDLWLDLSAVS